MTPGLSTIATVVAQTSEEPGLGISGTGMFLFVVLAAIMLTFTFRRAAGRSKRIDEALEHQLAARQAEVIHEGSEMVTSSGVHRCPACHSIDLETVPARVEGILPQVPSGLRGGGTVPTQVQLRVCRKCGHGSWFLPDYVRRPNTAADED